jgi:hypothetical protein
MKLINKVAYSYHPLELLLLIIPITLCIFLLWSVREINYHNNRADNFKATPYTTVHLGTVEAVDEITADEIRNEKRLETVQDNEDILHTPAEVAAEEDIETLYDETNY